MVVVGVAVVVVGWINEKKKWECLFVCILFYFENKCHESCGHGGLYYIIWNNDKKDTTGLGDSRIFICVKTK